MRSGWYLGGAVFLFGLGGLAFHWARPRPAASAQNSATAHFQIAEQSTSSSDSADMAKPRVIVVRPRTEGLERSTTQPGTIESFDYAHLYAKVSGYLDVQKVDIGDTVEVGQILATISVPEMLQSLNQATAELEQAKARVQQMEAAIVAAQADVQAAEAGIEQKTAAVRRATATLAFRKVQFERISNLFELKSIDARSVDERRSERDAAEAAETEAKAAVQTARAEVAAKAAKVKQAEADLANAKALVQVAAAARKKTEILAGYTKILSPYRGVVTQRGFHVGDFIRAADGGQQATPVLTVARTDLMRVVVQMPERYVPFTRAGDAATIAIDALGGEIFTSKVARVANALDYRDRCMRIEVDVKNPKNVLRDGMFGRVTVFLRHSSSGLVVPSTCVQHEVGRDANFFFVVREGRARRIPVKVSRDNGVQAEIISGLSASDLVVRRPSDELTDNLPVDVDEGAPRAKGSAAPAG